jgi:hypothetical protein
MNLFGGEGGTSDSFMPLVTVTIPYKTLTRFCTVGKEIIGGGTLHSSKDEPIVASSISGINTKDKHLCRDDSPEIKESKRHCSAFIPKTKSIKKLFP